jgi:aminoglycoside phosphotransferase
MMENANPSFSIDSSVFDLIQSKLGTGQIHPVTQGATNAHVFRIVTQTNPHYYLKVIRNPQTEDSLLYDKRIYDWLSGKVPVPEVIFYHKNNECEALCITEVPGDTLDSLLGQVPTEEVVKLYANALRELHSLPVDNSAPVQLLESRLRAARTRIQTNAVSIEDWEEASQGYSPGQLFEILLQEKPLKEDLVFTHGDYCFDNIMVSNGTLSRFIDVGRGGVADRYQDIALAVRTIRHELGNEWLNLFYEVYGLSRPDERKINFYTMLDEFF